MSVWLERRTSSFQRLLSSKCYVKSALKRFSHQRKWCVSVPISLRRFFTQSAVFSSYIPSCSSVLSPDLGATFGSFCERSVILECDDPNNKSWWENEHRIFIAYTWKRNITGRYKCKLISKTRHLLAQNDAFKCGNGNVKHFSCFSDLHVYSLKRISLSLSLSEDITSCFVLSIAKDFSSEK